MAAVPEPIPPSPHSAPLRIVAAGARASCVVEAIGNTPLVELRSINPKYPKLRGI